jgi:acetylornithine aminotransferase/acetylornithine/N-succinyldiaminopimelate aminotransferase
MGSYFIEKLTSLQEKYAFITEVRGKGLMVGVQVSIRKAAEIKKKCFEKGYLVGAVGDSIIRMLPPLIVTKEDIDGMVSILDEVFAAYI